jgi:hypothetical protein
METVRAPPEEAVRAIAARVPAVVERERAPAARERAVTVRETAMVEREVTARVTVERPPIRAAEAPVSLVKVRTLAGGAAALGGVVIHLLATSLESPMRRNVAALPRPRKTSSKEAFPQSWRS